MANWSRQTPWLPIDSLATGYKGPVVFTDGTQTIQWFAPTADRSPVEHREHETDPETGVFLFDDDKPRIKARTVEAGFWAPAEVTN